MTGATRPDIPAVPTIDAEPSGAGSPAPGPAKPAAATTWPSSGMSAEAWNEAAAAIPAEWVGAAEGHYSMHGAGLIRNILAGVAPLIRAAERERLGAVPLSEALADEEVAGFRERFEAAMMNPGPLRVLPSGGWRERAEAAEAKLGELENAITWDTSCTSCARILDSAVAERERAERAEARLAEIEDHASAIVDSLRHALSYVEHVPHPSSQAAAESYRSALAIIGTGEEPS